MIRRKSSILFAALLAPTGFVAADPPPAPVPTPVPTMHAETRVVQIDVVATDSRGRAVGDLTRGGFRVTDGSKPRAIDIFSVSRGEAQPVVMLPATSLPPHVFSNRNAGPPDLHGHSTVIVLDELNVSHDPDRTPFQTAADETLQVTSLMNKVPADETIALYVMAKALGLVVLQDYTTDRELLMGRLKSYLPRGMWTPPAASASAAKPTAGSPRRDPNSVPARETEFTVEEASGGVRLSLQALAEHLALVPGRKNVFLVRGRAGGLLLHGIFEGAWDKTIHALNEANVAVNTVGEIADRTGGQSWGRRNDLDAAMAEEIEASRTIYTLGFYLTEAERDDSFHDLTVEAGRPGVQLFYRRGYYAGSTDLPPSSFEKTGKGDLEASLLNRVDLQGIGITAKVDAVPGVPRGKVQIRLNLDPATLSLQERGTGWIGKVDEILVEQNANGNTLTKISDTREFEVTSGDRAHYGREGVAWTVSIPLMEGSTRLSIVVRDSKTGRVGSLTVPLK